MTLHVSQSVMVPRLNHFVLKKGKYRDSKCVVVVCVFGKKV